MEHDFDAGLRAKCWAYNGYVNSTMIEAVEGERVRIYVTNRLPIATSIHWHGMYLPNGMDGVAGLTQPHEAWRNDQIRVHAAAIRDTHVPLPSRRDDPDGMGLIGMFIIHPRATRREYHVDRDFAIMLSEWDIKVGTARPNTLQMTDFNILTMNGKVFPSTAPWCVKPAIRCGSV